MLKQKIIFYSLCIFLFSVSIFLFKIRFAILFISIVTIIISLTIATIKIGVPPFKAIYMDLRNDILTFLKLIGIQNKNK